MPLPARRSYLAALQVDDGLVHGTVLHGSVQVPEKTARCVHTGVHHLGVVKNKAAQHRIHGGAGDMSETAGCLAYPFSRPTVSSLAHRLFHYVGTLSR